MAEWWQSRRSPLLWWSLAGGLAAALKWHFSAAAADELAWMLRPLSLLLRAMAGWGFERNVHGEWESVAAGIVLVKACAGINFMILSFIGWCWMMRPRAGVSHRPVEWPVFLLAALVFAWACALGVNALRVLAIVQIQPWIEGWLGRESAHRALGIALYLPALWLQLTIAERGHWRRALQLACLLYAGLMLLVPMLRGHSAADWPAFARHAGALLLVLLPLLWFSRRRRIG